MDGSNPMTCQEGICDTTLGHWDSRFMTRDTTFVYGSTIGSNALDAYLTGYTFQGLFNPGYLLLAVINLVQNSILPLCIKVYALKNHFL